MVIVPTGAGVGSAVGFLLAPVAYEVARTHHSVIGAGFDAEALNALHAEMRAEATAVIRPAAPDAALSESWTADMRYVGQGHELSIVVDGGALRAEDGPVLAAKFMEQYEAQFGRSIPELEVEILSWVLRLATPDAALPAWPEEPAAVMAAAVERVKVADAVTGAMVEVALYERRLLAPGSVVVGPALIVEDETTTLVTGVFTARINGLGHIVMTRSAA